MTAFTDEERAKIRAAGLPQPEEWLQRYNAQPIEGRLAGCEAELRDYARKYLAELQKRQQAVDILGLIEDVARGALRGGKSASDLKSLLGQIIEQCAIACAELGPCSACAEKQRQRADLIGPTEEPPYGVRGGKEPT